MKKSIILFMAFVLLCMVCSCGQDKGEADNSTASEESRGVEENTQAKTKQEESELDEDAGELHVNALGAMTPEDALAYMKETENLIILDVAASGRYQAEHFDGAINIPIEELDSSEEDAYYMEIPGGNPVILHCRLGMVVPDAYERLMVLRTDIPEIGYIDGVPLFAEYNEWKAGQMEQETVRMGGISPEDALEYMKTTEGLVIVEVNVPEWKMSTGFTGAMFIPYTEMDTRYDEIPKERPVLLHCGGGIVSVEAYEILLEKRPDIPWLGYIAGAPMVRDYNEWLASQQ